MRSTKMATFALLFPLVQDTTQSTPGRKRTSRQTVNHQGGTSLDIHSSSKGNACRMQIS